MFCLIVDLIAYDTFSVLHMLHQFSYDTLAVEPVMAVCDVHDLSGPVDAPALSGHCHHIRMLFLHPCRNGIGRRTHDHMNPRFLHGIQNSVNVVKVKYTVLGFQGTPGGFCDPYQINPCLFHHLHVFFQSVIRHIFVVICYPIE